MTTSRPPIYGLAAEYTEPNELISAVNRAREAGYRRMDAYTPYPIEEVAEALGLHHSRLPVLVFSFHSPSLAAGFTPYVRSAGDLDAFYDWWRGVFAYLRQRQVAPSSVAGFMDSVELA